MDRCNPSTLYTLTMLQGSHCYRRSDEMHVWGAAAGSHSPFGDTQLMRCLWSASQTPPRFYLQVKVLGWRRPSLWSTGLEARTWCLTKGCSKTINLWYLTSLGNVCDVLPATSGTSPLKLSGYFAFMVRLFGTHHHTAAVISVSFQECCNFASAVVAVSLTGSRMCTACWISMNSNHTIFSFNDNPGNWWFRSHTVKISPPGRQRLHN